MARAGGVDPQLLQRALHELATNCGEERGEGGQKCGRGGVKMDCGVWKQKEDGGNQEGEERKRRKRAKEVEEFLRERVRKAELDDAAAAAGCEDEGKRHDALKPEIGEKSRASMHRLLFLD